MKKAATNNKKNWTLRVHTHSRDELIDLSRALAHGFKNQFFRNPKNIPHILIPGKVGGGKSMIAEAMMKTLLDEHNSDEMKEANAKRRMFIETEPGEACDRYCQVIGHTGGAPVIYGFDRRTSVYNSNAPRHFVQAFRAAAKKHNTPPVGAIFTTNGELGNTKPWIIIDLKTKGHAWRRTLDITVSNAALRASPQFQYYWDHLESFAVTRKLSPRALLAYATPSPDSFAKNITYTAPPDARGSSAQYETELLKFAFWHHDILGLSHAQIAHIAANTSDFGNVKAVDDFTDWLAARGEVGFVSEINQSKSRLCELFFKYVALDQCKPDAHKFIEYALRQKAQTAKTPRQQHQEFVAYFVQQRNGRDQEKTNNFLSVTAAFMPPKTMERFLQEALKATENTEKQNPSRPVKACAQRYVRR